MKKQYFILFILLFILTVGSLISNLLFKEKTAFVNVNELYNDFEMKKELESNYLMIEKARKIQIDSLELELKLINNKIQTEGTSSKQLIEMFESKRENYLLKKQQFEEDNSQMQQKYTSDIMKQLNQYVSDYANENSYTYIFGAEGSGAIMFADEKKDKTAEIKTYINNKFKGIK